MAAVERAYKRLIKEHHPDREGGCSTRAAELNRAYRGLNGPRLKEAIEFHDHPDEVQRRPLWSGASALSDDYLAIDGRLDRIRLRVELQLAADQPA